MAKQILTETFLGVQRQRCANVAMFACHNHDREPSSIRCMKHNTSLVTSESCAGPGVVDVDVHHCLGQVLATQYLIYTHVQVKSRSWVGNQNLLKMKLVKTNAALKHFTTAWLCSFNFNEKLGFKPVVKIHSSHGQNFAVISVN